MKLSEINNLYYDAVMADDEPERKRLADLMVKKLHEYNERARQFREAIASVCAEHKMSISHEDSHGAFLILPFDERLLSWFMNADANFDETEGTCHTC